jgi:hypothetical protein
MFLFVQSLVTTAAGTLIIALVVFMVDSENISFDADMPHSNYSCAVGFMGMVTGCFFCISIYFPRSFAILLSGQ